MTLIEKLMVGGGGGGGGGALMSVEFPVGE